MLVVVWLVLGLLHLPFNRIMRLLSREGLVLVVNLLRLELEEEGDIELRSVLVVRVVFIPVDHPERLFIC
jgi:hypothetical protein